MSKIRDPLVFSTYFNIAPSVLAAAGAVDPTLNVDLRLFIDPLLLRQSQVAHMRNTATSRINDYFEKIITLLSSSTLDNDLPWRQAKRLLSFHEVSATCLGYGAATIRGSGMGSGKTGQILKSAKEIINLGIRDPNLFLLLPLFEEGIGPDLISDMITCIIQPDLAAFTQDTLRNQKIQLFDFHIEDKKWSLPRNPCFSKNMPVLLVPHDILAELPIAIDRDDVDRVVLHNQRLRDQVNQYLGGIWRGQILSKRKKDELRAAALLSATSFNTFLELVTTAPRSPYSLDEDPKRHLTLSDLQNVRIPSDSPHTGPRPPPERIAIKARPATRNGAL